MRFYNSKYFSEIDFCKIDFGEIDFSKVHCIGFIGKCKREEK